MLYNIKTGYNGIKQRPMSEIVVVVSSLLRFQELRVPFLFTDRHAYLKTAKFFDDVGALSTIDWERLSACDFKYSADDPAKMERYQAEALAFRHVPVGALLGFACYSGTVQARLDHLVDSAGLTMKVIVRKEWLFG